MTKTAAFVLFFAIALTGGYPLSAAAQGTGRMTNTGVGPGNTGSNSPNTYTNSQVYNGNAKQGATVTGSPNSTQPETRHWVTPEQCRLAGKSYPCD